jgi:hypothetical protein
VLVIYAQARHIQEMVGILPDIDIMTKTHCARRNVQEILANVGLELIEGAPQSG